MPTTHNKQDARKSLSHISSTFGHRTRGRSSIVLSDYIFQIGAILQEPKLRALFRKHLQKEHSTESLDFITRVNELKQQIKSHPTDAEQHLMGAHRLFDEFIANGAVNEINLAASNKTVIRKLLNPQVEEGNQEEEEEEGGVISKDTEMSAEKLAKRVCKELLQIRVVVILQLEKDTFPRFVRNPIFADFVRRQDLDFVNRIAKLRRTVEFNYTDKDFTREVVTDADYEFIEGLAEDDPDWELMGWTASKNNSTVSGWFNNKKYFPGVKDMATKGAIIKLTGVFPFSLDMMLHAMLPGCNVSDYDNNIMDYKEIQYHSHEELRQKYPGVIEKQQRSCATVYFDVKLPFPMMTKRRYVVCSSLMYDPSKDQVMLLHKPLTNHEMSQGSQYDIWDFQYYRLRRLDENHTQFVQIHCFNLKGWATSKALQRFITFDRAKQFQKQSTRFLNKVKQGDVPEAPKTDYLYRLLLDLDVEKMRSEWEEKSHSSSVTGTDNTPSAVHSRSVSVSTSTTIGIH